MTEMAPVIKDPKEVKTFGMVLGEVKKFAQADDTYINTVLDGRTPDEAAKKIISSTAFSDEKDLAKLFDKSTKNS